MVTAVVLHPSSRMPLPLSCACFLAFISALPLIASEQQQTSPSPRFIWPLEINDGFSSTFGEYRRDHLHGGIDFRTDGESGYKVFAAADGDIDRIKVERRGDGNVIYIRHSDGWVTVYAHLERFENETLKLEDVMDEARRVRHAKYPENVYIDVPIPVKQGQVIGYSGESGAGLPHLHFETRMGEFIQVNPFLAGMAWTGDSTPPTIISATLIPDGADACVFGDTQPKTFPFDTRLGSPAWLRPVVVEPPLRLLVTAFDMEGTIDNSCHIYALSVSLDGATIYSAKSDRFSLTEALRVGLIYDLNRNGRAPAAFTYALDPRSGAFMPIDNCRLPIEKLPPGHHRLVIEAADFWGNTTKAVGELIVPQAATLEFGDAREVTAGHFEMPWTVRGGVTASPRIEISFDDGATFSPAPLQDVIGASGKINFQIANPFFSTRAIIRGYASDESPYCTLATVDLLSSMLSPLRSVNVDPEGRLTVSLKEPVAYSLRVVGFDPWTDRALANFASGSLTRSFQRPSLRSKRVYAQIEFSRASQNTGTAFSFLLPWKSQQAEVRTDVLPARNFVSIGLSFDRMPSGWNGISHLKYSDGTEELLVFRARDEHRFMASIDPHPESTAATVDIPGGSIQLQLRRVIATSSQRFVERNILLTFDQGAAYSDFWLWILTGAPSTDSRLRQVGDNFRIFPEGEPLARPARIQMRFPSTIHLPNRLGIYSWDPAGYWVYEPTSIDRAGRVTSTYVRRLGLYGLLEDLAPPTIEFVNPKPKARVDSDSFKAILVDVNDYGKGVDESSIRVTLDGRRLETEYDPDRHWAASVLPAQLRLGRHYLHVTARDQAGNYAVPKSAVFYLK